MQLKRVRSEKFCLLQNHNKTIDLKNSRVHRGFFVRVTLEIIIQDGCPVSHATT